MGDQREPHTVTIRDRTSGETVEYVDEHGHNDDDCYMWRLGNYSCDCNRSIFFHRAKGVPESEIENNECGDTQFIVTGIRRPNGELIYSETSHPDDAS